MPMTTEKREQHASNASGMSWLRELGGRFIVFDGPDGSGKSTQLHRFARACQMAGVPVCEVREPGGTQIGEQIRTLLLDHSDEDIAVETEMLLYMASRAQLVARRIVPALDAGELVLADRFVSSTLAYQGTAGQMSMDQIRAVADVVTRGATPDVVVIFDVDEKAAAGRLNPLLDRMEAKGSAFHKRVREGYLEQARENPDGHIVINASVGEDEVFASLMYALQRKFAPDIHQ
ncbi:MAG: dTMP kinase [Phycisphaeraceae bacterium]|nr:dTMP kinase [Phycisphaerales bacterium]MCB9860088.1 dTMP kinase [Phycisphaeraceae bacterium]